MKNTFYDTLSLLAVVAFITFTVLAQHSGHAAYPFGVLAMLTAAGLFAAYVKALPADTSSANQTRKVLEEANQLELLGETAITHARETHLYERMIAERKRVDRLSAELRERGRARELRQVRLFFSAVDSPGMDIKSGSYFTQVKFRPDPAHDPASIIANIVEKLCPASKEPRFEFILGPDGSFRIQQISPKRTVDEAAVTREEPHEEPAGEQVVN